MKRLARLIGSSPGPMGVTALAVTACALTVSNGGFNALPSADDTNAVRPRLLTGTPLKRSGEPCPTPTPTPTQGPATSAAAPASRLQPAPTPDAAPSPDATPTPTPTVADLGTVDCAEPSGPPGPATPGAASIGDPYFPQSGNGGYDATDYDVNLRFQPRDKSVDAIVAITATALQNLSAFDLDYAGPDVSSVTVDGEPASYRRTGPKLVITPSTALPQGGEFTTVVHYAGIPGPVGNPDLGTYGWIPTHDGVVVTSEPDGAPTWLPVNDHPSDKATYTFHVTVPADLQVLANGVPDAPVSDGVSTTYVWHERMPMASYLASIAIGHFKIRKGTAGGIPVITAVDPKFQGVAARLYDTTAAAVTWGSSLFGPYPFSTAGGIVDDPRLDYALETQEHPIYAGFAPDDDFIVHELAHQWFGDSVSLTTWKDIWLSEGFATYAEWLWHERSGKDSAHKTFRRYYEQPSNSPIFSPPPARPGRQQLFSFSVYIRGAMCLQALRDRVGSTTFFKILRTWAADHQYGNATTAQFEALSEQLSGQRLGRLFDAWLNGRGKPRHW